jgi:hypothetical protein
VSPITAGSPRHLPQRSIHEPSKRSNPTRAVEHQGLWIIAQQDTAATSRIVPWAAVDMLRISQFAVRFLGRILGCGILEAPTIVHADSFAIGD